MKAPFDPPKRFAGQAFWIPILYESWKKEKNNGSRKRQRNVALEIPDVEEGACGRVIVSGV
jgi:hypothetical protein